MTLHNSNHSTDRFNKIFELIKAQKIEGLLLNSKYNVSYAAGFSSPDSYALISKNGITLITDFRYIADFKRKACSPVKIIQLKGSIFKTITTVIKQEGIKNIGFESRHLPFAECEILNKLAEKITKFIPLKETIEPVREIKTEEEIKNIKKALEITLKTLAFIEKKLKPGISELQIAAEIEKFIRLNGASKNAFDTIVASGPNSSYPHAGVSERKLKTAEPIVIDMGVTYNGYKSDLTRTFFLGKITPIVHKVAEIVRQAQSLAIKAIKPGVAIKDIDSIARDFIAKKGFEKYFGHALGHGVGLQIHENPSINKKNSNRIEEGMIFTIEPGIYLPGKFGIRMEEMVLVKKTEAEVLSGNASN